MNYTNYERAIVEHYGVALVNFPGGQVKQPGSLQRPLLQQLLNALEDPCEATRCRWVALSDEEVEARKTSNRELEDTGTQVYVPRKKTVHRGRKTRRSGDDDDNDGSNPESDSESASDE